MNREKGRLSIRDVLKERDDALWEKLEEVWRKAGPTHEAIEHAKAIRRRWCW